MFSVTAIHAPKGASEIAKPNTRWQKKVNRFVSEYRKRVKSAGNDNKKASLFTKKLAKMKMKEERPINSKAESFEIFPEGISRSFVRGFFSSISAST